MIAQSKFVKPFEGKDLFAPKFVVTLGKQRLKEDIVYDVIQVSYRDNINELDSFDLTINNWDADKQKLKYTDSDLFDPGKKLTLEMGYHGGEGTRVMINGTIKSLRMTYPSSGGPQLSVSGVNVLDQFRGKQESFVYEGISDSVIARQIGGRLKPSVDMVVKPITGEPKHPYLLQDNKLDIVFLMERARMMGYELVVREDKNSKPGQKPKLYFGPPDGSPAETYELKYGVSLIEFTTTLNTANQVNEVSLISTHPTKKEPLKAKANRGQLKIESLDNTKRLRGLEDRVFKNRAEVKADKLVETPQEAENYVMQQMERIARELIRGTGSTLGLPDLRAGRFVGIHGIGEHFSGRYFVTSSTHTIGGSGYTTQFECRRE